MPSDQPVRCTRCNGTGKVKDHAFRTAIFAATSVFMPTKKTCSACNGRGKR